MRILRVGSWKARPEETQGGQAILSSRGPVHENEMMHAVPTFSQPPPVEVKLDDTSGEGVERSPSALSRGQTPVARLRNAGWGSLKQLNAGCFLTPRRHWVFTQGNKVTN